MYSNSTKRRSRLKDKFLVVVLTTIICLVVASPFVLNWDSGKGIEVEENLAQAFDFSESLKKVSFKAGLNEAMATANVLGLPVIIGRIIRASLALIGVVFLIIAIVAGYRWMMAGGNEETVANAKKTLTRAIIGVLIIFGAYVITYYVLFYMLLARL